MKIKIYVGTNRVGSTVTKYIDLDDDMTEDEIDEAAWEAAIEMIEFNYEIIDE